MTTQPSLNKSQLKSLAAIFPGDAMSMTREEMLIYGADAGQRFAMPWAVVRPESKEQVQELMRMARRDKIPVIPRARGTNVVSACVPGQGGIILSCLKMNKILSIKADDFSALVEPGVVTSDLQQAAFDQGLFYPPDPASMRVSTIGGNIATNAGGMRAVKYGVTRDYVLGLEAVLPGGQIIRTGGRVHKNVVGLDMTRLLTGSEGILAIIVSAWVKLLPAPEYSATVLACFQNEDEALTGVRDIFRSGLLPCAMEFMPIEVMQCLARYGPVPWPQQAQSALIIRLDGSKACVMGEIEKMQTVLSTAIHHDLALQDDEERIWELRRLINPASFSLGPDKAADDVVTPRGEILRAVQGIRKISEKYKIQILSFGHIGDGNIHVNYMYDASDVNQKQAVKAARKEVLAMVLEMGGSISGEHGIGLAKKPFVAWQLSPGELEIMKGIKKVFDPDGILNPGKVF